MIRPLSLAASIELPAINWQKALLLAILLFAAITQGVNMLAYPFYDHVEGINVANAWSIRYDGQLSPYTYNYDKPPMGWVLLAAWFTIASLAPTPETVLSSGRVFMLVVHILTLLMVYGLARKLHLSQLFAILAVLLFSLSPLATILQRRILVENLMTLWVLVALYCSLGNGRTLLHYALSALALGMAFLTHIVALSFLPALIYIVLSRSHISHRRFVLAFWSGIVFSMLMAFPTHALLKDELLPAGVLFGGSHPHVSLFETQAIQLERISSQDFLRDDSSFIVNLNRWMSFDEAAADMAFILMGLSSAGLALAVATFWQPHLRPLALVLVLYGLHLATLKRVYDPDIIPLLPFLAITIGIAAQTGVQLIQKHIVPGGIRYPLYAALAILFVTVFGSTYVTRSDLYRVDQTQMQLEAIRWIRQHAPPDSLIVSDSFAYVDLRRSLPNTHYYWVVDLDPQVRSELFKNSWCGITYLITSPQVVKDMDKNGLRLLSTAQLNSRTIQMYENNGWPIDIREVNKRNCNIPFP
jgi:4-amino-4-deoxy-L-arabinose transferase-like glycosyltransferase